MPSVIHLLPDSVANQIAAGEVVQRPASVLKELVENSIDAKATQIDIVLRDAGRTLLQVIDNGHGMTDIDARLAFERHATSKISDAIDIFNLHTMGFRGEALPSIAAVSQVEIRTRMADDELGTQLNIAGSQVENQEVVQCPVGTNLAVRNLFYNTPARRRFLKSNTTELKNLINEFYRIVLAHPRIAFTLTSDDRQLFDLKAATTKQRIDAVFTTSQRHSFAQQLLTIETETEMVTIRGYIGKPESAQKSAQQYFFVNGRYMRHPYFHKAVMNAYEGMIAHDANPHYFIYFDIDPSSIDVNIHPTKTEIHFADEQTIWPMLMASVKETLGKFSVAPRIDFDQDDAVDIPVATQQDMLQARPPQVNFNPRYNPFDATQKADTSGWEKLYEGLHRTDSSQTQTTLSLSNDVTTGTQAHDERPTADSDYYQICRRYILTHSRSGVLLIDQHRAHLRVLFDQYMRQLDNTTPTTQQLLFPEVWDVNRAHRAILDDLLPQIRLLGFDLEPLGPDSFSIGGVPADLTGSPVAALNDMLCAAVDNTQAALTSRRERIAFSLACSAAIKADRVLTQNEMRQLVERLFACPTHTATPDGKAIMTLLTTEQIGSFFK